MIGARFDAVGELDPFEAMATDALEPAGVYFGTSSGALYVSADEGDSWRCIAQHLPAISSVETLVVDA